jgi:hypothetical protein
LIVDTLGTCWYRQNINGDLRQFGVTLGSDYDCKHGGIQTCIPVWDSSVTPAVTILQNAVTAAKTAGVYQVTTSGVQIYLASAFSLDGNMTLDGGVGSPEAGTSDIDSPGTISEFGDTIRILGRLVSVRE